MKTDNYSPMTLRSYKKKTPKKKTPTPMQGIEYHSKSQSLKNKTPTPMQGIEYHSKSQTPKKKTPTPMQGIEYYSKSQSPKKKTPKKKTPKKKTPEKKTPKKSFSYKNRDILSRIFNNPNLKIQEQELETKLSHCQTLRTAMKFKKGMGVGSTSPTDIYVVQIRQESLNKRLGNTNDFFMKVFIIDSDDYNGSALQYEQKLYEKTNMFLLKNYTRCLIPMIATSKKCTFGDICKLLSDKDTCSNNIKKQLFYNLYAIYCSTLGDGLDIKRDKIEQTKNGKEMLDITTSNEFTQCAADIGLDAKSLEELIMKNDLGFIMTKSAHGTGHFRNTMATSNVVSNKIMYSYIFQIFYTLYVFSSSKMNHNDLHMENILMDAHMLNETKIAGFILPISKELLLVSTPQVPRIFDYDRSTTTDIPNKLEDWLKPYGQTNEFYPLKDFAKVGCQIINELKLNYPVLSAALSSDIERYPGKLMSIDNATGGNCFYTNKRYHDGSLLNTEAEMKKILFSPEEMLENIANRLKGQFDVTNFLQQNSHKSLLKENIFAGPNISIVTKNKIYSQLQIS